jgi:hypothetical protein
MDPETFIDPNLTRPDLLVLQNLLQDVDKVKGKHQNQNGNGKAVGRRQNGAIVSQG